MARRIRTGHYKLGETKEDPGVEQGERRLRTFEYGVVKGRTANTASSPDKSDERTYWGHLCPDALYRTKWFVYRVEIDPGDSPDARPQLLGRFDDKETATSWLKDRYADEFTRTY